MSITLSDADSMVAQSPVSGAQSLQLLARLSMSGNVVAGANDLASQPVLKQAGSTEPVTLSLAPAGQ